MEYMSQSKCRVMFFFVRVVTHSYLTRTVYFCPMQILKVPKCKVHFSNLLRRIHVNQSRCLLFLILLEMFRQHNRGLLVLSSGLAKWIDWMYFKHLHLLKLRIKFSWTPQLPFAKRKAQWYWNPIAQTFIFQRVNVLSFWISSSQMKFNSLFL